MLIERHLKCIPFEAEQTICIKANKKLKRRPSSVPFISGDSFRAIANFIYDETRLDSAEDMKSLVFVKQDMLKDFADKELPQLKNEIVLVTNNSDCTIGEHFIPILENPLIKHCYSINTIIEHPKLTTIPLGLENAWQHNAGVPGDFKLLQKRLNKIQKKPKILLAFNLSTNPQKRSECFIKLSPLALTEHSCPITNCKLYRRDLLPYMFVASPPGNGPDCHRTWEAIYLKVIPLVEDNQMHRYFKSLGLPIYLVKDWSELASWTEDKARGIYQDIMQSSNTDAAYFDYWKNMIYKELNK